MENRLSELDRKSVWRGVVLLFIAVGFVLAYVVTERVILAMVLGVVGASVLSVVVALLVSSVYRIS